MKLFLINWGHEELETANVALDLIAAGHEIAYWVRSDRHVQFDRTQLPHTVFHDFFDALVGKPAAALREKAWNPPGEALIVSLAREENVLLTMLERDFGGIQLQERIYTYYDMLAYWYGVLRFFRPDVVFFRSVPHRAFEYVLYAAAKHLNIPTLLWYETVVGDRLVAMRDYREGPFELATPPAGVSARLDDVAPDVRSYYLSQIDPKKDSTPGYMKDLHKQLSASRVLRRKLTSAAHVIKDPRLVKNVWKNCKEMSVFVRPNLKKEHERVQKEPDMALPFVYVPLNYQPECTTSPMGGIFTDQLLMLQMLSAALPQGWKIYVKEHPTQWKLNGRAYSMFRFRGFYETIAALPNTVLLPITTKSASLIEHAKAVATVTGTAGWEAVLRGKPALVFGYPDYLYAPGVFLVRDAGACQSVFQKMQNDLTLNVQDVINYLAHFSRVSFRGYVSPLGKAVTRYTPQENRQALAQKLLSDLEFIITSSHAI